LVSRAQELSDSGKGHCISILVVAPTRELALQTYETMAQLGQLSGIRAFCVYGGTSKGDQVRDLKKIDPSVLVGTPGRILDLVNEGTCDITK
jgi:ATP-dependent RNA helicase DBP3